MQVETSTDFCRECGELLDLQSTFSEIVCQQCKTSYSLKDMIGEPVVTRIAIKEDKEWLLKYHPTEAKQKKIKSQHQRMLIDEKCPNCMHNQMYSMALQTRSADEGSTVFLECPKCGYGCSKNN